jgi:SAM-dependent methyltransferase
MGLQEYYEDAFRSSNNRSARDLQSDALASSNALYNFVLECKDRFLQNKSWADLRVLETGSGRGGVGLQLARLGAQVTLLDFSPSALAQAEKVFALENLSVKAVVGDVARPDVMLEEKFDIIVDSHLLHCLTEDPDRVSYYRLIQDSLVSDGIFVCESMVHRKKLNIPDGFMFDQRNVLWQMFGKWTPIRRILDSYDLENELKSCDFDIKYFIYYGQFAFVPHKDFMDIPSEVLPAAVRMVLSKA